MSDNLITVKNKENQSNVNGALFVSTGLAVASMIIVPAIAARMGLGPSLTGALRMALMKASSKMANSAPETHHA